MLVLIALQFKVLIGLVTSESVPGMKFFEKVDEAWDSKGTGCFFMQLFEAARETELLLRLCTSIQHREAVPYNTNLKFTGVNL
jgi:hypothetical protein